MSCIVAPTEFTNPLIRGHDRFKILVQSKKPFVPVGTFLGPKPSHFAFLAVEIQTAVGCVFDNEKTPLPVALWAGSAPIGWYHGLVPITWHRKIRFRRTFA